MAQVDLNADIYAQKRLNIFFKGVVPSLDGQCVSLVKWFMQEMSEVPNPQAARGDARYVGKRLVAEGHAKEVPYADRKRGDIICYEYGTYGHIGVVLSGNRTFEQNVNWAGVSSKIVDGARVYASRIGSLSEAWRHDQHIYRLKTYSEGVPIVKPTKSEVGNMFNQAGVSDEQVTDKQYAYYMARDWKVLAQDIAPKIRALYVAKRDELEKANIKIAELTKQLTAEYEPVGQLYKKKDV